MGKVTFAAVRRWAAIFLFIAGKALGQITDDSTKLVYGAHTTFFTNEHKVKNNVQDAYENPDTTVYKLELYDIVDRQDRRFQSLGFLGSPLHDLFLTVPDQPGRTFGFTGYNAYWRPADQIRYFDTRSPFFDVGVTLGGNRRSKIDIGFARNVNEHWNVGFNIHRITADKQIGSETIGDRATESSYFDLFTYYANDEKPYSIGFSLSRMKHQVADIGGILVAEDATRADYFQYNTSEVQLQDAVTVDLRNRWHLYHQYKLGSGLQVYHQLDFIRQEYAFTDYSTDGDVERFEAYYPDFLKNPDTTVERTNYQAFENEVGLKGTLKGVYYRFYAKRRSLVYNLKYQLEQDNNENYLGTYLRFDWKDRLSVTGRGEVSDEGAFLLRGDLASDWGNVSYRSSRVLPSYLVQRYEGNHHFWQNSFRAIFYNEVAGNLSIKWRSLELRPEASVKVINNFIYFDAQQQPDQLGSTLVMNQIGGQLAFNFLRSNEHEHFRVENGVSAQRIAGPDRNVVRIPAVLYTGRVFWRGLWFQNAVPVEIGSNVYFRTGYMGNQYTPVLSQFYLQNELPLETYTALDAFINMKIQNLRASIKWTHINQRANDGYFASPFFPAQASILDLTVQWLFFD